VPNTFPSTSKILGISLSPLAALKWTMYPTRVAKFTDCFCFIVQLCSIWDQALWVQSPICFLLS
jgi:hypothetical protein